MSATRWLVGLCALIPLQGCVTDKLWNDWRQPDLHGPSTYSAPAYVHPAEVVEAVRTGDGAHHLVVHMSNGMDNRYVIDAVGAAPEGDAATIGSHQWPNTTTSSAWLPLPRQVYGSSAPPGLPLAVTRPRAPEPVPDPAMTVLLDAQPDASPDDPVVSLDDRKVVVTDSEGQVTVLAEFSPPPAPRPAPGPRKPLRGSGARAVETSVRVVLTPFAVATDVVLGAGVVVGCTLLVPFFFIGAPLWFR